MTYPNNLPTLPLMESFYTLQGEGYHQGRAAYFIRLGGCDVGCFWCDVKDSWDMRKHPQKSIEEIVSTALASTGIVRSIGDKIAVVTGGEPLLHNLFPLTAQLKLAGFRTHIETSGSSPMSGNWDWVCLSPKKFKEPLPEVLPLANELKIIVYNQHDFEWAESYARLVSPDCMLYLQPEWDRATAITPKIIAYIQENPKWSLSLQIHKYMGID